MKDKEIKLTNGNYKFIQEGTGGVFKRLRVYKNGILQIDTGGDGDMPYNIEDNISERLKTLEKLKELGNCQLDSRIHRKK